MPRIRFTSDFDFKVNNHAVIAYKAGRTYLVSQEAAAQAIEAKTAAPAPRQKASNVIR